ncbi:hypothetical protein GCM10025768_05810 [Microbacterium pseudoresistens]|uniref:Uncharacterized protein n=1 Tax=Microbacterium pseudoresistens TaxID=640634 RepID=A0A7Y9EUX5_9MICO|nr:hypothetical protein [Microbacterium pseudoresistens]NYD54418.1 hypothetical protein [Microbacterium pseudoresistens]
MGTIMTRGWWRRNAIGLAAVAVLAPATALAVGGYEWYDYFSGRPAAPVVAEDDGELSLGGATWGPVRSTVLDDTTGMTLPADARVIIAAVPVAPDADAASCERPRLVEQATGRQWEEARFDLGIPSSSDEPSSCGGQGPGPFTLYVAYVVPDDATGPFWLDVPTIDAYPSFARFPIDPSTDGS